MIGASTNVNMSYVHSMRVCSVCTVMYMCFPYSYVFDGKPPEMKSEEVSACFMHVVFNSDNFLTAMHVVNDL